MHHSLRKLFASCSRTVLTLKNEMQVWFSVSGLPVFFFFFFKNRKTSFLIGQSEHLTIMRMTHQVCQATVGVDVSGSFCCGIYDIDAKSPLVSIDFLGSRLQNTSGKQATCIRIVDAKCESFSIYSRHDSQSRSVIPQTYRGIKIRG